MYINKKALIVLAFLSVFFVGSVQPAQANSFPNGFTETLLFSGLDRPTTMAFAPDGRIFIAEQSGALRVVRNG